MTINYKKVIPVIVVFILLIILAVILQPHKTGEIPARQNYGAVNDSSQKTYLSVVSGDILNAGYTGVTEQQSDGTNYQSPNLYFWVNGASRTNTMPDGNFDLLMVSQYTDGTPYTADLFSYGTSTRSVGVSGARAQEAKLADGRVALNFAKGNYYIVIIGPDSQKVESLANIVAKKI